LPTQNKLWKTKGQNEPLKLQLLLPKVAAGC
jgi:hypothetical protein